MDLSSKRTGRLRWGGSTCHDGAVNSRLHADELPIDEGLVRRLIEAQFPKFSGLPLARLAASGSSNVLYKLGDKLLVRLPRQPGGGAHIIKEAKHLPSLAQRLPVSVPDA